jgi:hypothetical protein
MFGIRFPFKELGKAAPERGGSVEWREEESEYYLT